MSKEKDQSVVVLQRYFQQQPAIKLVMLFGSVACNKAHYESDIDIAVESEHVLGASEKTRLIEGITAITGRAVDLIDLKTVGQPLLGQIVEYGYRLTGDDVNYGMLLSKNVFEHEDFSPYRQRILDVRRRAWIGC